MSSSFYDNIINYQIESGINDRIYSLYKRTKKIGIKNKKILETGCGIGALTYLLSKKIRKGKVEALDPSERSIKYAQEHIRKSNVFFKASDILNFTPQFAPYDLILIFDVLEHIPEADHFEIFSKIKNWMNDESLLLINLPNPEYILFDQKHYPEHLQEIDQSVFIKQLVPIFNSLSLELKYLETYSVWVKEDYQFLIIQKQKEFTEVQLSTLRSFPEKTVRWLQRKWIRLIHRFPKQSITYFMALWLLCIQY